MRLDLVHESQWKGRVARVGVGQHCGYDSSLNFGRLTQAPELKSLGVDCFFDRMARKIVGRSIARPDCAGGGPGTMVLREFAACEVGREGTQIFPRFRLENINPHSLTLSAVDDGCKRRDWDSGNRRTCIPLRQSFYLAAPNSPRIAPRLERDDLLFESLSRSTLLLEHDLFRKPASTFRDHALEVGLTRSHRPFAVHDRASRQRSAPRRGARFVIRSTARPIARDIGCGSEQWPSRRNRRLPPKSDRTGWSTFHAPRMQAGARLVSLPPAPVLSYLAANDDATLRLTGAIVQGVRPWLPCLKRPIEADILWCARRGPRET
jgi:hypothetical protein